MKHSRPRVYTQRIARPRGACAPKRGLSLPPNDSHLEILQRGDAARRRPQTTIDHAGPTSSTSKRCSPSCLPRSRTTRRTVLSNRRSIWKQSRRLASGTTARRRSGPRRRRRCRPAACLRRRRRSRPPRSTSSRWPPSAAPSCPPCACGRPRPKPCPRRHPRAPSACSACLVQRKVTKTPRRIWLRNSKCPRI